MPPAADTLAQVAFGLLFFLIFALLPVVLLCSVTLVFRSGRDLRTFGLLICAVIGLHMACYWGMRVNGVLYACWHQGSIEIRMSGGGDVPLLGFVELTFGGYGFIEAPFARLYTPPPTGG